MLEDQKHAIQNIKESRNKEVLKLLEKFLTERLNFAEEELKKRDKSEGWVNDDSFLQSWAEKRLIDDIFNVVDVANRSAMVGLPKNFSHPIYRDELTGALNLLLFLYAGLDTMEIITKAMDADHLRNKNQENGYLAGDEILKDAVKEHSDQDMVVFRIYGDSFCAYDRKYLQEKLGNEWYVDWKL